MKYVLVPIDFSEHAQNALEYALTHLQNTTTPCRLFLLNTYLVPSTKPEEAISLNDQMKKQSLASLQKNLNHIKNKNQNDLISFETISCMGSLGNIIGYIIKDYKIDCVIVGADFLADQNDFFGTSAQHLLSRSSCPILIVPFPMPTGSIKTIAILRSNLEESSDVLHQVEKFMMDQSFEIMPSDSKKQSDLLVFVDSPTLFLKTFGKQAKEKMRVPVLFVQKATGEKI